MSDTATLPMQEALKPATEMAEASKTRWPGESENYRRARTALLAEEIALRRQIQRVAEQRRALPPGPVAKDYRFLDEQGNESGLADLFGRHETLFTYLWMYGPERARPCPMCTSFVGSSTSPRRIEQRLQGRSRRSPSRALRLRPRGCWRNLNLSANRRGISSVTRLGGRRREGAGVVSEPRRRQVRLSGRPDRPEPADPGFDPILPTDRPRVGPFWNGPRACARLYPNWLPG